MNLKQFFKSIKEDPFNFFYELFFLLFLGLIFYVGMWIFYIEIS